MKHRRSLSTRNSRTVYHRTFFIALLIVPVLTVCSGIANGAPPKERDQRSDHAKDWSARIGVLSSCAPAYEGSDDYELRGFPLIDITFRDTFFVNARKGIGAYVWNRNNLKVGLSIGYTFGRDEGDSDDLRGLGDIDDGATANLAVAWGIGDVALDVRYEEQITGHDTGFQVHLGLGYDLRITEETTVKPSVHTTYASSEYMEEYFGVSPSQSSRSGISTYDADSGFKSIGFHLTAIHRLDRHWGLQAGVRYERLVGEAADSPTEKEEDQYGVTVGLSYTF